VQAGDDLIAGIWEATARRDNALAAIMFEMAQNYAPDHRDLPVLRLRVEGRSGAGVGELVMAGLDLSAGGGALPKAPAAPAVVTSTPEEAAIAAILMPPKLSVPAKQKSNPWVAFAAGTFACLLMLVIVAALTLAYL
jgi:hypothetical protein